MKKSLTWTLLVCLLGGHLSAQNPGQIVLGIGAFTAPFLEEEPESEQIMPFLSRALASTGMAFAPNDGANFSIHTAVRAGYQKAIDVSGTPMTVAELTFSFDLRDRKGTRSFAHLDLEIRESGESPEILLRNAIRQLRSHSRSIEAFLTQGKSNILTYYQDQCAAIIAEAQRMKETGHFEEAMMFSGQVPVEVPCYQEASKLFLESFTAGLDRQCEIMVSEVRALAAARKFNEAYEKALLLPGNSRCMEDMQKALGMIADAACEAYLLQAEAFYAKNDLDRCVEALAAVETVGPDCAKRKNALEARMKNQLQAAEKARWDLKQQQYQDALAIEQARLTHDFSMDGRRMDQEDSKLAADLRQKSYDQDFRMKKLDKDAEIRAKELAIAPELEKYRSRVAIQQSKDQRMVQVVQTQEAGKVYQSYFRLAANGQTR
jgi:hypothetical protein